MTSPVPATDPDAQVRAELAELLRRTSRRSLSRQIPVLRPAAVGYHRTRRRLRWWRSDARWATNRDWAGSFVEVVRHDSLPLRQLGSAQMWMQHNKVHNLRLATARVDGLLIAPGETFSFNRTVGNANRRRGYLPAMRLSDGQVTTGVGGGLCQLANLIHWLVLHTPLTVVERSTHSFDPFPDDGRVVPWGVGVTIVHNYLDLTIHNDTDCTFRFAVHVGETHLHGTLCADVLPERSYRVFAHEERFLRHEGRVYRRNQIRRAVSDRRTGQFLGEELVRANLALVNYEPAEAEVRDR